MILQLSPQIPVEVVGPGDCPLGHGHALMVLDYSQDHSLLWVVAYDHTREVWCVPTAQVRATPNISLGR